MSDLNLSNIDTDKLFEQYTISEILEIHKKIQLELEKKKQELRFMVGERYRDVLTAADAIKSMQTSAETLCSYVTNINAKSHILQNSIISEEHKPIILDKQKSFERSVAVQIKILISIPEYIWVCLDQNDYLKGVHLYLFAIHIHTGLELDTENKISERFPILSRLKLSISSFRNRILDGIKKRLQTVNLQANEASNHLCAYILLENKSQEFVITKFIEFRQICLTNLLQFDLSVHNVVRVQIINLINCIICTILLLHSCFIDFDEKSNASVQMLMKKILSADAEKTISLIDLESTPLINYLPVVVKDFRLSCVEGENSLSKESVQKNVNFWLDSTLNLLKTNLVKSLELVTSVNTLQNIREEALKIEKLDKWENICLETYLPNGFTVWKYFFQSFISKRAEKLISQKIETNLQDLYNALSNEFSENIKDCSENDLRWYIWRDEPEDVNKTKNEHHGLTMKTKGHSKRIVSLCKNLDEKYLELIQDVDIYLNKSENAESERKFLENHVRSATKSSLHKLVKYIENIINDESNEEDRITKSVMAARLLQAIPQLCPNLIKSCSYGNCKTDWKNIESLLTDKNLQFWSTWLVSTIENVKEILKDFLVNLQYSNILKILPRWSVIDIEEQTEDRVFNSQIKVPSQPSITLLKVLYEINRILNAILPHTLPRSIHLQFIESTATLILLRYENSCEDKILNQNVALQFLMDVKFLTTICIKRDNKELIKKSQDVCDSLRCKIDPFDLDVFYPYLQNNVKRSVIQSQAFFGSFLPASAQLASLGTIEPKSIDSEPCIVAISVPSTETWFPLLPVTAPILKTLNIPSLSTTTQVSKKEVKEDAEQMTGSTLRSGAAALFGAGLDWFS